MSLIKVCNTVDSEQLPYFKYVTGYVMGEGVQQKTNPDTMVSLVFFSCCCFLPDTPSEAHEYLTSSEVDIF